MPQITITMKSTEKDALRMLAEREYRDLRSQAALIIRRELERRGLLETRNDTTFPTHKAPQRGSDAILK